MAKGRAGIALTIALSVSACGRCGYDLLPTNGEAGVGVVDAASRFDGASGADGAVPGDAAGSDVGVPGDGGDIAPAGSRCPHLSTPMCTNTSRIMLTGTNDISLGTGTISSGNFLSGSCGGAEAEERSWPVEVGVAGRYRFAVEDSSVDTVMYVLGPDCAGPERLCTEGRAPGGPVVMLDLSAGERITVVVDGQGNRCGSFQLNIRGM